MSQWLLSEMSFIHFIFILLLSSADSACYMQRTTHSILIIHTMKVLNGTILSIQMKKLKQSLSKFLDSHTSWTLEKRFTPWPSGPPGQALKNWTLLHLLLPAHPSAANKVQILHSANWPLTPGNSPVLSCSKKKKAGGWRWEIILPFFFFILL